MTGWTSGLQPWLRPYAEYLVRHFPGVRVTSVYRSYSDQLTLYLNRSRNKYPVARPGQSYHQYGRAWDMTGPSASLQAAGAIWRSWGGTWSPSDEIHFQA